MPASFKAHVSAAGEIANALTTNTEKIVKNLKCVYDKDYPFSAETKEVWAGAQQSSGDESGADDAATESSERPVDGCAREAARTVLAAASLDLHRAATEQGRVVQMVGHLFKSPLALRLVDGSLRSLTGGAEQLLDAVSGKTCDFSALPAASTLDFLRRTAARLAECNSRLASYASLMASTPPRDGSAPSTLQQQQLQLAALPSPPTTSTSQPQARHLSVPASDPTAAPASSTPRAATAPPTVVPVPRMAPVPAPPPQPTALVSPQQDTATANVNAALQNAIMPIIDSDDDDALLPQCAFDDLFGSALPQTHPQLLRAPQLSVGDGADKPTLRARQLREGLLNVVDHELGEEERRIIEQSPTMREVLAYFATKYYNVKSVQLRTYARSIGASGPQLWVAALDVSVPVGDDIDAAVLQPERFWEEERTGETPRESEGNVQCLELVRSEPGVRGNCVKQRAIALAIAVLFPRVHKHYRALNRDDGVDVDDDARGALARLRADGLRALSMSSFALDGTSFVEQAFRLMTNSGTNVGALTWSITEVRNGGSQYNAQGRPDSFFVRIRSGNGDVIAELSSADSSAVHAARGLPPRALSERGPGREVSVLVPTVHDALLLAATELGVRDQFVLLKRSFGRVQVPVVNEPREYIINFIALLFGMDCDGTGSSKRVVEVEDRPLGGGWCTTVRVCTFEDPLERRNTEENWVTLESVAASTKKVSRNEAFLSLGKSNFTAELLRMLEYGPAAQKAHAETILLTRAAIPPPVDQQPAQDRLLSNRSRVSSTSSSTTAGFGAVGQPLATGPECEGETVTSAVNAFVAEKIMQSVPKATAELEMWLQQVYPGVRGKVSWDAAAMESFRATLQCKGTLTLGVFITEETDLPAGVDQKTPLRGPGPLNALFKTLRQIKETVDRAPLAERNRAREMPCA